MVDAAQVESYLRAHSLPVIETLLPPGEFVMPHYQGLGFANLPATVAALLGSQISGICPPLRLDL